MSVGVMPFAMAIIVFLWRILKSHMANIASPYGENYFAMAKIVWVVEKGNYHQRATLLSSLEHYGDGCFFAKAFNSFRLISRAMLWRSASAKRANREAESGSRCSSVVKYWFNGSMTTLMNSKNCPASFCLSLPSIDVA